MENRKRAFVIIDGSNFYHRLKELKLTRLLSFDYEQFSAFVAGETVLSARHYYVGAIREETGNSHSRKMMSAQRRLTGELTKYGWLVRFGHMLKTDAYREKGVDVQMAVDILIGAFEKTYNRLVLVSSDTDLIPALKKVRSMGKSVEYVGFSHKPSYGLIANSDVRRLLRKEELEQFL